MAATATETTSLIAFTLPSTPYSVQMARFYVRAALTYHGLAGTFEDAETVTSELVTNAITHADASVVSLELTYLAGAKTLVLIIVVTDRSPAPPVMRNPSDDAEHFRGLHLVEALSTHWGWRPRHPGPGKAVYAVLTWEKQPAPATAGLPGSGNSEPRALAVQAGARE